MTREAKMRRTRGFHQCNRPLQLLLVRLRLPSLPIDTHCGLILRKCGKIYRVRSRAYVDEGSQLGFKLRLQEDGATTMGRPLAGPTYVLPLG